MKRLLSGLFLIFLVVSISLHTPIYVITIVVSLLVFFGLREFCCMTLGNGKWARDLPTLIIGAGLPFAFLARGPAVAAPYLVGALFVLLVTTLIESKGEFKKSLERIVARSMGLFYIALTFACFTVLYDMQKGRLWVLLLLAVVSSNDTFAYCTGRLIGKTKLAPTLSPGKTIEGAIGGLVFGTVAILVFNHFGDMGLSVVEAVVLSIAIGVVAIFGDLFESLIKRGAGVKDSGTVIPGHGGILDRVDSLIFTVPMLYYYLLWRGAL